MHEVHLDVALIGRPAPGQGVAPQAPRVEALAVARPTEVARVNSDVDHRVRLADALFPGFA
eukprot:4215852-Lingulodinium_polyedra.AAC.1